MKKKFIFQKFILFTILLLGLTILPFTLGSVRAQSNCTDPATGLECTPTPLSGCFDAAGAPCTTTPPPPSCGLPGQPACDTPVPQPTNTPVSTRTLRPTFIPTTTPTSTVTLPPRSTLPAPETATPTAATYVPTLPPRATMLPGISPQPTQTQVSDVALAPFQSPRPVTPKANNGPFWSPIVNWFGNLVKGFFPSDDLLWLTRVNVVDAGGYYCVGGPMCPSQKVSYGNAVKVLIMPEGLVAPEVLNGGEQDFYPVLCQGKTGQDGCSEFINGHRPGPAAQWSLDNYFYKAYGKSLPGVYEFDLPSSWVPGAGTYTFTAYINYNQKTFSEDYSNNFITFQFTVAGDPSVRLAPSALLQPDNVYYFDPATFVVLQGDNCVLGCSQTTNGAVNAGLPVEVYTRALGNPTEFKGLLIYGYVSDPIQAAMFACKGSASQNGCANPFAADTPPYVIPQWFLDSPDANLLNDPYRPLIRFTIPGDQIFKSGVYKFTLYVNYLQQASPEKTLSDNTRLFYLQVFP